MKNKTEILKSVNGVTSKAVMKLKKHSPEILVVAGIAGTVVSAVLACKATTKVAEILDETKGTLDTIHEGMETGAINPLEEGATDAWNKLMSTIYSEEERTKIEWAIGSIVCGESKKLQKFMVLYGAAGTGKSTVLNIVQQLFEGYYSVFDAKALGSSSNSFALEAFKTNPLVAIQHDGDLSRIEDNTRLNSLVSHELMTVNEKFKSTYANRFKCFLFMGTNKPVKITDAKSGLIRRLIDVSPSGNKLSPKEYKAVTKQIEFELGAIAYTDGTEHITQLNRSVNNNLMSQIEYLTSMLYSQLGITQSILDGTADEKTIFKMASRRC